MAINTCPVDCLCHTSSWAPCSVPGGCGSEGCGRDDGTRTGSCPVCEKRDPLHGIVCEPCRTWLPTALAAIPALAAEAAELLIPDDEPARILFAGPAPSIAPDVIITGGAVEPSAPLDLHLHDLLADVVRDGGRPIDRTGDNWVPALDTTKRQIRVDNGWKGYRTTTVLDRTPRRDPNGYKIMVPAGDQIGAIPIAAALDQEARAMADAGAPGARWRPTPTIPNLATWIGNRLNWACDHYDGIDALAETIRHIRGQLMNAVGEIEPDPEPCTNVRCDQCHLQMLYRRTDGTGDIECHNPNCRRIMSSTVYQQIVTEQAATAHHPEPAEEATHDTLTPAN